MPPGRRPADEHRRVLRCRLDRLRWPGTSTRRSGCCGWPTPRSTAPSGPGCAGRWSRVRPRRASTWTRPACDRRAPPRQGLGAGSRRPSSPASRCSTTSPGPMPQARLEAVAEHLSNLVDAGWLVGVRGARGRPQLITAASSVHRSGDAADERQAEQSKIGAVFELADFPATERAVREAASFAVEIGVPRQRPRARSRRWSSPATARVSAPAPPARRHRLAGRGVRRLPHLPAARLRAGAARPRGGRRRGGSRPGRAHRRTGRPGSRRSQGDRRRCRRRTLGSPASASPRTRGEACRRSSRRSTTRSRSTRRRPSCGPGSSRAAPPSTTRPTPPRASSSPASGCGCWSTRARSSRTASSPTSPPRICPPTV